MLFALRPGAAALHMTTLLCVIHPSPNHLVVPSFITLVVPSFITSHVHVLWACAPTCTSSSRNSSRVQQQHESGRAPAALGVLGAPLMAAGHLQNVSDDLVVGYCY